MPIQNWRIAMTRFMIAFEDRLKGHIKNGVYTELFTASCGSLRDHNLTLLVMPQGRMWGNI
jgi:hypothetical protein